MTNKHVAIRAFLERKAKSGHRLTPEQLRIVHESGALQRRDAAGAFLPEEVPAVVKAERQGSVVVAAQAPAPKPNPKRGVLSRLSFPSGPALGAGAGAGAEEGPRTSPLVVRPHAFHAERTLTVRLPSAAGARKRRSSSGGVTPVQQQLAAASLDAHDGAGVGDAGSGPGERLLITVSRDTEEEEEEDYGEEGYETLAQPKRRRRQLASVSEGAQLQVVLGESAAVAGSMAGPLPTGPSGGWRVDSTPGSRGGWRGRGRARGGVKWRR